MPPTPRPRNAAATTESIRLAARRRFAADGYEHATIRAIAADAGIDPAMVMRYFRTKESLFLEAADFDLRLPDLTRVDPAVVGTRMAQHFLDRWEQDETFTALLRAAVTQPAARSRLQRIILTDRDLAAAVARLAPEPDSVPARTGLVAAQVLGVALGRYVLGLPPVADMPREQLTGWLGASLQRYLVDPVPAAEDPPPPTS